MSDILTEDVDYHLFGQRVQLDTWLKKWELDEILSALRLQELVKERKELQKSKVLKMYDKQSYRLISELDQEEKILDMYRILLGRSKNTPGVKENQ